MAAKESGLKLLVGAEITPGDAPPVVVWAIDRAGYGRLARLHPPLSPFTDTLVTGVYNVRQLVPGGVRSSRFVVEFNDPELSRVAPGAAAIPFEEERAQQAPAVRGTLELWPWLVGAVLALLVLEWFIYLNPTGLRFPRLRPR